MLAGAPAALLSAAHYEWIVILIRTYFTINDISDKNFSDEFCVQNSPPACVSMFTTICSTCTSHLRPPRPPIAENGIFGQKLAVLVKNWPFWGRFYTAGCTFLTSFASRAVLLHVFQCVPPFAQLVQAIWGLPGLQWAKSQFWDPSQSQSLRGHHRHKILFAPTGHQLLLCNYTQNVWIYPKYALKLVK